MPVVSYREKLLALNHVFQRDLAGATPHVCVPAASVVDGMLVDRDDVTVTGLKEGGDKQLIGYSQVRNVHRLSWSLKETSSCDNSMLTGVQMKVRLPRSLMSRIKILGVSTLFDLIDLCFPSEGGTMQDLHVSSSFECQAFTSSRVCRECIEAEGSVPCVASCSAGASPCGSCARACCGQGALI
jgi:hypothetical protein